MRSGCLCLFLFLSAIVLPAEKPSYESRVRGMLWGALVADAAALGAHWYYDQEDLKKMFPGGIVGFETPAEQHYHKGKVSGELTMYGDALKLLLETCAAEQGYSVEAFGKQFMKTMTPGHYAGYIDHATRETFEIYEAHLKNSPSVAFDFQQGSDDNQMAGATSLMPIVALFDGSADFYERIAAFVRIRQNHPEAIAYCQIQAGILSGLLNGGAPGDVIADVLKEAPLEPMMREAIAARVRDAHNELISEDITASTVDLGYSCPLPGSFPASLYSFLKLKDESYEEAILSIIRAGGESAGRGMLVGAWLGALHGDAYIPEAWRNKLADYTRVNEWVDAVASLK